jgi:alkylhydroperoxidase/carboxymuconolactone decarboxylase family protein YurZ
MDERTRILICLGCATAANCVPCFEHFLGKAEALSLTREEVQEAVDLASQVKNGANMVIRKSIKNIIESEKGLGISGCHEAGRSCSC